MGFGSSLGGALFGSKAKSKSSSAPWEAQQPYLKQQYTGAQNLRDQQMAAGSQFQNQLASQNQAWQSQLAGAQNPYLTGMASNAMNQISRQFNEQIMPSLLGGGNAAGQLGGERYQLLQDSAVRSAAEGMGNAANEVYGNMANLGIQAQSNAIGQGQQVMGGAWQPLMSAGAVIGAPVMAQKSESKGGSGGLLGSAASLAGSYYGAGGTFGL